MDYTLVVVCANGETHTHECATPTDVSNWMHSSMRSQFASDLDRGVVTFHVIDNTKAQTEELLVKTPAEWCELLGARIMDPDGWRYDNKPWKDRITKAEFDRRFVMCTVDTRGYMPERNTT